MELYVAVAGNGHDQWKHELEAIKFPYKHKAGEPEGLIRLGVADVKLYKLYFPSEHLDLVMSVVGVTPEGSYALNKNPRLKTVVKWLRKFLKLKEAPLPKTVIKHMQPDQHLKSVVIMPIGTREDEITGPPGEEKTEKI